MKEMFNDNGVMREIVKVACPIVEGNDQGFYIQYRDAMRPDEVEYFEAQTEELPDKPTKPKRR